MNPLWTILVPTVGRRGLKFSRLMDSLLPQTDPYGGQVTVLALWNNGERPLPDIRDRLMEEATSVYTCFVDDDDELPGYYVENVVPLLDGKTDYIGWKQQYYEKGVAYPVPTYHYLRYGGWRAQPEKYGWLRDISHLNPVRRELALEHARFSRPGMQGWQTEDHWWAEQMRPYVKTERRVPKKFTMYRYMHDEDQSVCMRTPAPGESSRFPPSEIVHPNFSWSKGSFF